MNTPLPSLQRVTARLRWRMALLVVVAGGLMCCPPAIAARPGSTVRPTVVADSGFRPPVNGFAFPNYGEDPNLPNLGPDEMRQLFGDGVCAGFTGGLCVLSPPALAWMTQENDAMADGHCVGFSITALFFHARLSSPTQFGALLPHELKISGNQLLAREIAYTYTFQDLNSVRNAEISASPQVVVTKLISALRTNRELYTLGITQSDGSAGHAVTPYEVERVGANHYEILVYDNNYPRTTRAVSVNTKTNTWSFTAAPTPSQPGSVYTGDTATHSLFLLPTTPGLGVQPCPFCSTTATATPSPTGGTTTPGTARTAAATQAGVGASPYETIRLLTSGPVSGHLLITDPRGRRLGFVNGKLVNQVPGARVLSQFSGGVHTWQETAEPEYEVRAGEAYRITLTGTAPSGGVQRSSASQSSQASVTVLEPGFVGAVRRIDLYVGQQVAINLTAGGHAISFRPNRGAKQAPLLVVGNAQPGARDHQWNFSDHGTPAGEQVTASLNLSAGTVSLTGAGTYETSMDLVGNGVSVFNHDSVPLAAGTTLNLDYSTWSAGDSMPATDTNDGTVTDEPALADQPDSSDNGDEFSPSESTPAPVEPQPHSTSGATATTLQCSPATVAVGESTNCTVDVTNADSDASGTPTGQIEFRTDSGGAFSAGRCTISRGSCEVTYTPTAVGSGTHTLTASFDATGPDRDSSDLVAETVTLRQTDLTVACDPEEVVDGQDTTCTATVTDTDTGTPTTPTGTVMLDSSDSMGMFAGNPCTLSGSGATATCTVTYTPASDGSTTDLIGSSYSGDATHASYSND